MARTEPWRRQPLAVALPGAALALLLQACAWAPGLRLDPPLQPTALAAPAPLTQGLELQPITPNLIASQAQARPPALRAVAALLGTPAPYTIGPGDVLAITVWSHPELALPSAAPGTEPGIVPAGHTVNAQGDIQFAHIGLLRVAGLSEAQARERLTQALSTKLREPEISLRIQAYRSQKIFIDGEVRNPGQWPITDVPMTLAEALARAGGLSAQADSSRILLLRQGQAHPIDLPALLDAGISPARLPLQHLDVLRIPPREESKVSVLGEIARPGTVPLRNGRLNLNQALSESGGLAQASANPRQIYVIRGTTAAAQVFHLDAHSPVLLSLAEQFQLQPQDVVYVDAAPLALWNRVVSLILPTSALTQTTRNTLGSN